MIYRKCDVFGIYLLGQGMFKNKLFFTIFSRRVYIEYEVHKEAFCFILNFKIYILAGWKLLLSFFVDKKYEGRDRPS